MNKFRFQSLMSAAAALSGNFQPEKFAQSMLKWGAPGKHNRRGTPIVPGRLTSDGKGYARLDNGALVVAVEPEKTRTTLRPNRDYRRSQREQNEADRQRKERIRQYALTGRLKHRHALRSGWRVNPNWDNI